MTLNATRTRVRTVLAATLIALSASHESRAQSTPQDDDLIEASVDSRAAEADGRVRGRVAELRREAAYERHTFFRFRRDLSQVRRLAFYVNPETKAIGPRRDSPRSVRLVAVRSSVVAQGEAGYLWRGELRRQNHRGEMVGEAALYVTSAGGVSGSIEIEGESYLIESAGGGVSMVIELNEARQSRGEEGDAVVVPAAPLIPGGGGGMEQGAPLPEHEAAPAPEPSSAMASSAASSSSTVLYPRILVLYTNQVKTRSDANPTKILEKIQEEVAATNSAYGASQINEFDLQLAGVVHHPSFVERNTLEDAFYDMANDALINTLRDQYEADMVMMVVSSATDALGIGTVNATTAATARTVISWDAL